VANEAISVLIAKDSIPEAKVMKIMRKVITPSTSVPDLHRRAKWR